MSKFIKIAVLSLLVFSCAGKENRVALPADTNVKTTIAEADRNLQSAYANQWDVLANEELQMSATALKKAKELDREGKSQDKIIEKLEDFQTSYRDAHNISAKRSAKVQGLLTAREAALTSGIQQNNGTGKEFSKLDSDFRGMVTDKTIDTKDYSDLQKKYLDLAAVMKKERALSTARSQVKDARAHKAASNAPQALNMAELDLKSAENMIDANQDKPETYGPAVDKVNRSAGLLAAIVNEQRSTNYNLDEGTARKLVQQKGLIAKMDADLAASKAQLSSTREDVAAAQMALQNSENDSNAKGKELSEKDRLLAQAEAEKRFQAVIASAQTKFSKSEADVYRQGDKLLIRLKTVGFVSGGSAIPDSSKAILDKVTDVAKELSPKAITVEGHTDSVGSAEVNDSLSKKRADTVATYLKEQGMEKTDIQTVGLGFQKPLSSNKTKEGRAQNRRVDIWITPEEMATTTTTQ